MSLVLNFSGEGRVGEDGVEEDAGIRAAEADRERIEVADFRTLQLVQVEIEDGDFHHVGVVVEAGERLLFEEFPLRGLEQRAVRDATPEVRGLRVLAEDVEERGDEKADGAARGIADALARLRIHERDDEADDVAGAAELAIRAGGGELAEEILIHVALEVVAVVRGQIHRVNALDDGAERGAVVDFQRGAAKEEPAGVGEAGEFMQALDGVADGVEKIVAGERDEVAPREARPFAGEDARVFFVEAGEDFVLLREQAEEEQIRTLLDGIHRVVHAARVEDVHELVHLLAQAGGEEIRAADRRREVFILTADFADGRG